MKRPLQFTHNLLKETIKNGDKAIDATVGNGHDTVILAKLVGNSGKVYGFDIQSQAIQSTEERLIDQGLNERVILFQKGHEHLNEIVHTKDVKAVTFNLGYLPKGDKDIITLPETTILAINHAMEVLAPGGVITIMVYFGHPGGTEEKNAVLDFVSTIPQDYFTVYRYQILNQINHPPFLIVIEKKTSY